MYWLNPGLCIIQKYSIHLIYIGKDSSSRSNHFGSLRFLEILVICHKNSKYRGFVKEKYKFTSL